MRQVLTARPAPAHWQLQGGLSRKQVPHAATSGCMHHLFDFEVKPLQQSIDAH